MNAGSPHLDVDQLLAAVTEPELDDPATEHLTVCPDCRAEAERWAAVAAGVRYLVAASPAPPDLRYQPVLRHPAGLRQQALAARPASWRRRMVVAAAAAAALVAAGASYGLTAARTGPGPHPKTPTHLPATSAGLTAVHGCPGKYITAGTLEKVSGTEAIIHPANDADHVDRTWRAQAVTVATSASTAITRPANGTVSDITDGLHVDVNGTWSGDKLVAAEVGIQANLPSPGSFGPRFPIHLRHVKPVGPPIGALHFPFANGTVIDAHDGSFTVVVQNPIGGVQRVHVTTSTTTKVLTRTNVNLSQLKIGANVVAVGPIGPHKVLRASTLAQTSVILLELAGGPAKIRPSGCSAAAITTAAVLAGS